MLREARPQDRPALVDLWVAAWQAAMPDIDFTTRRPWLEACLDELEAEGARLLVADWDGRPAGFATVDRDRARIDQLAVDPARQGHGIASALLEAARTLCPGGLELTVNRDNEPARRLYARHEFVEIAEGTNPTSGLPTLILRWTPHPGAAAARD